MGNGNAGKAIEALKASRRWMKVSEEFEERGEKSNALYYAKLADACQEEADMYGRWAQVDANG